MSGFLAFDAGATGLEPPLLTVPHPLDDEEFIVFDAGASGGSNPIIPVLDDGTTDFIVLATGAPGPRGDPGVDGVDGTPGTVIDEIADVPGLVDALAGKAPALHDHDLRYYTEVEVDALLDGYAPKSAIPYIGPTPLPNPNIGDLWVPTTV